MKKRELWYIDSSGKEVYRPRKRRKHQKHRKHSSNFVRLYGISCWDIAKRLEIAYATAWKWMQDPDRRAAILKDLDLTDRKESL